MSEFKNKKTNGFLTTFYSYKGGVGRTFLLANVAWLLASWGNRVLCLDWDLEAPGLKRYIDPFSEKKKGILDLLDSVSHGSPLKWQECVVSGRQIENSKGRLDFIGAGVNDQEYISKLQQLDWKELSDKFLESKLEAWRAQWIREYDHVLIDSRTGISDVGGICAAQLPDLLVLTFTPNFQSLEGAIDVAERARKSRELMPLDRGGFNVLPVPSRVHVGEESRLEEEWSNRFESSLENLFAPWKSQKVDTREYLSNIRIKEEARWSFGENIPVKEEEIDNHSKISFAFANIAALIEHRLVRSGEVARDRHHYIAESAGTDSFGKSYQKSNFLYDVFISYPHRYQDTAQSISSHLKESGLRVFFDRWELDMGDNLSEVLSQGLSNSRNFVMLLSSDNIAESRWQASELSHIVRRSQENDVGVVIPILLDEYALDSAPPEIQKFLGLELENGDSIELVSNKILNALKRRDSI